MVSTCHRECSAIHGEFNTINGETGGSHGDIREINGDCNSTQGELWGQLQDYRECCEYQYSTHRPSPSVTLDSPYSHSPASDRDTWRCLCDKCDPCASYAPPVRVQYALGDASTTIVRPIATVHSRLSRGENFKHV